MYRAFVKRLLDLCFTIPALVLLSPLFCAFSDTGKDQTGRSRLFRQRRPEPFTLLKFRTMTECLRHTGQLASRCRTVDRLGKFLRSTSLDELPELINVLKADMSLTGPRPLLIEYLKLYTTEQMRRHEVKPGITGWAQINGRNLLSWEQRFEMDVWYADHYSLQLDLKILLLTLWKVIRREGISQEGHATQSNSMGTAETVESKKDNRPY